MVTVTRFSTLRAVNWLRQKTRTKSTPPEANGEWTDADIVEQLNVATLEIVNQMLAVPWCPYFLRDEPNVTTVSGKVVVGVSGASGDQYGVIKVATVRRSTAVEHADKGKFLRPMSINRFVHTVTEDNPTGLLKISDTRIFYVVRQEGSQVDPTAVSLTIQLHNNGSELPLDITYYAYPRPLSAPALDSEFIGLPILAINALLAYTLMLMSEDPGDSEQRDWAKQRYDESMNALRSSMHLHHDMPNTLVAGVNTDNT